jgi:hypothetical protein
MPGNLFTGPPVKRGFATKYSASSVPPQSPAMALKTQIPREFAAGHSELLLTCGTEVPCVSTAGSIGSFRDKPAAATLARA